MLIPSYLWYMYLHLIFLIMTGFYESRKTIFWMHLRFMITLVMLLQSHCQQCSSLLLFYSILLLYVQEVYTWIGLEARSVTCWVSIRFGSIPTSQRHQKKSWKNCLDIFQWYACSNVCSNILPLTFRKYVVNDILQLLYKQASTSIHNASIKIEIN